MKTKLNIRRKLARMFLAVALLLGAAISSHASSTIIMSYDAGSNGVPAVAPNPTNAAGGSWNAVLFNVDGTNTVSEGLSPDPLYTNLNAWR
ncbi:MAG TPA: hypothetical protein VKA67_00125, partial [Verrucomicrobiae bacterium]|nr:hypothetical protein [Verrucomicrobiae bacterium]